MNRYRVIGIGTGFEINAGSPYTAINKAVSYAKIYQPKSIHKLSVGEHITISVTRIDKSQEIKQ